MARINEYGLSEPLLPTNDSRPRPRSVPSVKRWGRGLNRFVYISVGIAIFVVAGLGGLYVTSKVVYHQRKLYQHPVFEPPLRPAPVDIENLVEPTSFFIAPTQDGLQRELENRYAAMGMENAKLECPAVEGVEKYSVLRDEGRYLFALNLYNNEAVLPTLASTLLAVSEYLGGENVHVSIFENGSQDRTKLGLAHLAAVLTAGGIPHTIRSDSRRTDWSKVDRIAQLSEFRNLLLDPLAKRGGREDHGDEEGYESEEERWSDGKEFTSVVFINDVFTCPGDVLKLLWEKRENGAHAACAMDWRKNTPPVLSWFGWGDVKFYDNWVSRTISGNTFRPRFDVWAEYKIGLDLFTSTSDSASQTAFLSGRPFPVYSCWNGIIALDSKPFLGKESGNAGVKQTERGAVRFRSAGAGECKASECKVLARDFWARGFDRWIIVPTIRVTYDLATYHHPTLVDLSSRDQRHGNTTLRRRDVERKDKIDWKLVVPPKTVACYSWTSGVQIDLPYRRTMEPPW